MSIGKYRFQKKYVAFLTIVPLIAATSLIQVDDPVCGGTGLLSSSPEMANVEITSSESRELYVTREICEQFIAYKYEIALDLKNNGDVDAVGWIKLILKNITEITVIDIQYLWVAIPAQSALEANYTIWFGTGLDIPGTTEVNAEVVDGQIPDQVCGGTGKISLNTWLLAEAFKDNFSEVVRIYKEYTPPRYYPPDTEGGGWAE